jgi:outer membrane murein-binding lipoprotein Lpp
MHLKSVKGADAHRQTIEEIASSSSAALDTATVLRVFLKSAKGSDAAPPIGKELARPSGGAFDTATVLRVFLGRMLLGLVFSMQLLAQNQAPSDSALLDKILERVRSLEEQNRQLAQELRDLRQELQAAREQTGAHQAPAPSVEERVGVTEARVAEQAQTKVEASQKFPISITGELLFNAFANTGYTDTLPSSAYSPLLLGANSTGATLRQTMVGLLFHGPSLPGDGKISGELMLDFYSPSGTEEFNWLRLRSGRVSLDWKRRSLTIGKEKPIISPRQPNSLAEVAIPPLADSGNLWLWLPQVRYEERFSLGESAGLKLQASALQTDETYNLVGSTYAGVLTENARPAGEGRLAYWQTWGDRRIELGAGVHRSTTHLAGKSADSKIASLDWLFVPASKLEFSGSFFHGQNFAGLGALAPGVSLLPGYSVRAVHSNSAWGQISSPLTTRLTLNLFAGVQDNAASSVLDGNVKQNFTYAGNFMYRLSPNVIVSLEALQQRSQIKQSANEIHNRYDLALAYLF